MSSTCETKLKWEIQKLENSLYFSEFNNHFERVNEIKKKIEKLKKQLEL